MAKVFILLAIVINVYGLSALNLKVHPNLRIPMEKPINQESEDTPKPKTPIKPKIPPCLDPKDPDCGIFDAGDLLKCKGKSCYAYCGEDCKGYTCKDFECTVLPEKTKPIATVADEDEEGDGEDKNDGLPARIDPQFKFIEN
eukprot:818422_1